jgi:hypothetical protein
MFGLSSGWCCTHSRAIWIQRIASNSMHESLILSSTNLSGIPSFHNLHAYKISIDLSYITMI